MALPTAPRLVPCATCGHLYVCHLLDGASYAAEMKAEGYPECFPPTFGTIPRPVGHVYVEGTGRQVAPRSRRAGRGLSGAPARGSRAPRHLPIVVLPFREEESEYGNDATPDYELFEQEQVARDMDAGEGAPDVDPSEE